MHAGIHISILNHGLNLGVRTIHFTFVHALIYCSVGVLLWCSGYLLASLYWLVRVCWVITFWPNSKDHQVCVTFCPDMIDSSPFFRFCHIFIIHHFIIYQATITLITDLRQFMSVVTCPALS